MKILSERNLSILIFSLAGLYLGLAIIGGFKNFSPVPYWDMWNGYLDFYMKSDQLRTWISNHNEHRIVLSRVLFWLDFKLFNGSLYFLIIVNYLLAGISFLVIYATLKERLKDNTNKNLTLLLGLLIFCLLFSWDQNENFIIGFQSQFFLAQLLPLSAFFLLYKAHTSSSHAIPYFILACVLGILAYGTMLNAIFTLPLMLLLALMLGMHWSRILTLFILCALIFALYVIFSQALFPINGNAAESVLQNLLDNPLALLINIFTFMGTPLAHLTGLPIFSPNKIIITFAGAFFVLSAVYFLVKAILARKNSPLELTLVTFLIFIGITVSATILGRHIDVAISRYLTPVFMAWAVLLVLYAPFIVKQVNIRRSRILVLVLAILLLLVQQFSALENQSSKIFTQKVAALALALGVSDEETIKSIYPTSKKIIEIADKAAEKDLSIFGNPLIKNATLQMQQKNEHIAFTACKIYIENLIRMPGELDYLRVEGSLVNAKNSPSAIQILDQERQQVGYALVYQSPSGKSNFKGYVLTQAALQPLIFKSMDFDCETPISFGHDMDFFTIQDIAFAQTLKFATPHQIIDNNEWLGSDYQRTQMQGIKVFGSYIHSDYDKGAIHLQLSRGDSIFFRSGPSVNNQFFMIALNNQVFIKKLPLAENWVILEFSNPQLPENFKISLIDNGSNWGEWSAIALKEAKNTP